MPVKNKQIIFLLIFMILGFVFSLQLKSNLKFNMQKTSAQYTLEDLKKQLEEEKLRGKALKTEIKKNEKKNEENLKSVVDEKHDEELKNRHEILNAIKLKAGLVDVKGPGVIVKLDDAPARTNENPNVLIIHDSDVLRVVNELKKAEVQAISINGERIVPMSEQVCAGPTIRINKRKYAAPFVIHAVGNPDQLYDSLMNSETIAMMINDKIKVEISKSNNIMIPKYNSSVDKLMNSVEVLEK
ncbi:MAG: DUF881 domain-containing protein [Clostridia bacterium]|nr:DUF881 domain-containing protein [Clostridia bacterium]